MAVDSVSPVHNPDGRPPTLTPAVIDAICALIRRGVPLTDAARGLGIPSQSVHNWQRKGRAADGSTPYQALYRDFIDSIEAAQRVRATEVDRMVATARVSIARGRLRGRR